jgi:hypothetical protein
MSEPVSDSRAVAPIASPATPPSAAARDQVVELLTRHFAADGIALDEFERRTAAVFSARSGDELRALVADVPGVSAATHPVVPDHGRVSAVLSNTEQRSTMVVPRHLEIVSVLGNAELDLRDATFGDGVTIIEVRAILGNVEITVPHDVRVEMAGNALLGSFASHAGSPITDAAARRVVRLTGRALLGNVEVTSAAPPLLALTEAPPTSRPALPSA